MYGVDISDILIERCQQLFPKIKSSVGDAENLVFEDGFFDLCFCVHSTWYFPDVNKAISEMIRVTKKNGHVCFDIQNILNKDIKSNFKRHVFENKNLLGMLKKFLRNENPFCHSSVVFRKSKVDLIAGYNSNYKTGQDYNLWVRLLVDSRGIVIPDVYVHRTNSLGSVSMMKRKEQKFNACKSRLLAIKEFGGDFRSIFNLFMSLIKLMVPNSLIRVIKRHDTYN